MKRKTKKNDIKKGLQVFSLQHKIIKELGVFCSVCGNTDIRVLCLHHIIPEWKTHKDSRTDLKINHAEHNLECLCANCHMIKHCELRATHKGKPKWDFQSYQSFPESIKKADQEQPVPHNYLE